MTKYTKIFIIIFALALPPSYIILSLVDRLTPQPNIGDIAILGLSACISAAAGFVIVCHELYFNLKYKGHI